MDKTERFSEQETRIATLWIDHDGIGHALFKENAVVDVKSFMEYSAAAVRASKGAKIAVLLDIRGLKYANREARELFAKGPPGLLTKAVAVVIRSLSQLMLTKFFLLINKPAFPMKVFRNEKKALAWVRAYK